MMIARVVCDEGVRSSRAPASEVRQRLQRETSTHRAPRTVSRRGVDYAGWLACLWSMIRWAMYLASSLPSPSSAEPRVCCHCSPRK
jgi:hypothetical protein